MPKCKRNALKLGLLEQNQGLLKYSILRGTGPQKSDQENNEKQTNKQNPTYVKYTKQAG